MVRIANLALYATAVFGAVIRRDLTETLNDLATIDTATKSLTSTITSWDGSTIGAIGIATSANTVGSDLDKATADAQDEPVASSADSATVINYITATGEPDIEASLNALVARKADFTTAGVSAVVLSTLQTLKSKSDNYGAALLAITSSDQQTAAQAVLAKLDADFTTAITAFS